MSAADFEGVIRLGGNFIDAVQGGYMRRGIGYKDMANLEDRVHLGGSVDDAAQLRRSDVVDGRQGVGRQHHLRHRRAPIDNADSAIIIRMSVNHVMHYLNRLTSGATGYQ